MDKILCILAATISWVLAVSSPENLKLMQVLAHLHHSHQKIQNFYNILREMTDHWKFVRSQRLQVN